MTRGFSMFITDVDGTLLDDDGRLSRANLAALQGLIAGGVHVTLATGRTLTAARGLASRIGIRLPIIAYNGSQVATADGQVLFERRVAPAAVDELVAMAARLGLAGFVYLAEGVVPVAAGAGRLDHLLPEDREHCLAPHTGTGRDGPWHAEGGAIKVLFLAPNRRAAEMLMQQGPAGRGRYSLVRSGPDCVEAMPPGVSKATGVRHLARRLGVRASQVVAVGNAGNDLEMLRAAGAGVAVASAEPEALAAARYVAPPHREDGVAVAARHFFPHLELPVPAGPVAGPA